MADMSLEYRDETSGPRDRAALWRLLEEVFGLDITPLEAQGLVDPSYRSFSWRDADGQCIANVSTVSLPLIVEGRAVDAMGIQSVATLPGWRGRGLSRSLMERALAWCDSQSALTFLMTDITAFYAPMGFRALPQCYFAGPAPQAAPAPAPDSRRLDTSVEPDRLLLEEALRHRAPVSSRFSVRGWGGIFLLNAMEDDEVALWRIGATGAIIATAEREDGTLAILDVVAAEIPPMAEIVAALGVRAAQVETCFPPDKLNWDGVPRQLADTETMLMVRGDLTISAPIMLPPTAAF
jgi:predicted N-acetyltransferase YhbS